jgi:hypothetical protein
MGLGNPGLFQDIPDIAALLSEGGGDGEQAGSADGALGRLDAPAVAWQIADLALDDGRPQRSLGSVVGGLDSLSLQEGSQRISHLQELLAGAHRAGPWRSLAALSAQLHHLLESGYRCAEVFDYKRQPERLAMVLQLQQLGSE